MGTLQSGSDPNNIFGTGHVDLSGESFSEDLIVDTTQGVYGNVTTYYQQGHTGYSSEIYNSAISFPISGSVTLGGTTVTSDGKLTDKATFDENTHIDQGDVEYSSYGSASFQGKTYDVSLDAGGLAFVPYGGGDPLLTGEHIVFFNTDFSVGGATGSADYNTGIYSVKILAENGGPSIIVSAAPEPATWALMFAGLGGIGLLLRRSRKSLDATPCATGA